jgi:predicted DNA-binding protein
MGSSIRVGLSLPQEMVDMIDALADKEERTRANYILWVLKKHLEDMEENRKDV